MNILMLTTGSVSAYLSHKLAYQLKEDGHEVKHYITKTAGELMILNKGSRSNDPTSQCFYTNHYSNYISVEREGLDWHDKPTHPIKHIDLVKWADICVVCPADYNVVGKMANGIADDFVTSVLAAWLGCGKKLYIAESMNSMMYQGPVYQRNRAYLDSLDFVRFIEPTVKNLACGGIGIGGLADVGTIKNIVEGHVWHQPILPHDLLGVPTYVGHAPDEERGMFGKFIYDANSNEFTRGKCKEKFRDYIPRFYEPGAFGAIRKFDIHEGVDIYTHADAPVYAVEDGVVTAVYEFTGKNANCSWWNPTWCVKVEGKSGVVTYGELSKPIIEVGEGVLGGVTVVGHVTPVLRPEKYRPDIRNHSVAMLHLELRTETCHLDGWKLEGQRDKQLLDPTPYLKNKDLISS